MFKSIFISLLWVTTVCATAIAGHPAAARAEEYWNARELLSQQFKASERVTYLRIEPNSNQRARIEARIHGALPKTTYTFFVATTHGHVDGYALFDEQVGQHEPISFATFFDADGHVTRVEVVAYREPYGDGIRADRFRKQFVGRSAQSKFRPGEDIDAVSGATISSRSMCIGVERATALFEETVAKASSTLAAR
jgi:Na+-translocating ferredoxin:NAD+ oxidoreductase RnfG subunit